MVSLSNHNHAQSFMSPCIDQIKIFGKGEAMNRNLFILLIFLFVVGCAGIPVRDEVRVDSSLPVGKIEGNTFQGIRYPFKASLPSSNWKFSVEIPDFMEGLGFKRPGLEESELFLFNPDTRSNI